MKWNEEVDGINSNSYQREIHLNMKKRQVVVVVKRTTSSSRNTVGYNHAAYSGGYAVDGCMEFMACSGEEALTCAACGCHRNFHKRKVLQSTDWGSQYLNSSWLIMFLHSIYMCIQLTDSCVLLKFLFFLLECL